MCVTPCRVIEDQHIEKNMRIYIYPLMYII